jgi:hypothetical protein
MPLKKNGGSYDTERRRRALHAERQRNARAAERETIPHTHDTRLSGRKRERSAAHDEGTRDVGDAGHGEVFPHSSAAETASAQSAAGVHAIERGRASTLGASTLRLV